MVGRVAAGSATGVVLHARHLRSSRRSTKSCRPSPTTLTASTRSTIAMGDGEVRSKFIVRATEAGGTSTSSGPATGGSPLEAGARRTGTDREPNRKARRRARQSARSASGSSGCFPYWPMSLSTAHGKECSVQPVSGRQPSDSIATPVSPGPAATLERAWLQRTWPHCSPDFGPLIAPGQRGNLPPFISPVITSR
jgi:hypothetical protein